MKKKIIIITSIIIALISICLVVYQTAYLDNVSEIILTINGDEEVVLDLLQSYEEKGYQATFRNKSITEKVKVTGEVDSTKIGTYHIKYQVNYNGKFEQIIRKITVVDREFPTIELIGENKISIYAGQKYNESGYKAFDNYDGDITGSVIIEGSVDTNTVGIYTIVYKIKDSSGNESSATREVEVKRQIIPSNGVAVLNYHFFYSDGEYCGQGICLNTKKFEQQLKYLNDNGYKTLTMDEFVKWIYGEIDIPKKSVLLTIDDGAMGTGLHNGNKLIPLLEKYNANATLFLISGWWDINNYKSANLDIESHTYDMHTEGVCTGVTRGAKLLCSNYEDALNDLKRSIEIIGSSKAFCYPFYAYNNQTIQIVKDAGFKVAFAGGNYKATRGTNKYAIPRYVIYDNTSLETFINYIS